MEMIKDDDRQIFQEICKKVELFSLGWEETERG